jgi:hypothetical protein
MTRARANNTIEPTEDEAAAFLTVDQVADWAALGVSQPADGPRTPDPVRDSLYAVFGLTGSTHVRVLASIPEVDFEDALSDWKIPGIPQLGVRSENDDEPGDGAASPTHAQRAQAGLFGRAARIACGSQRRVSEVNANADLLLRSQASKPASSSSGSTDTLRKVKLSQVIDQTSEVEVSSLSEADIAAAFQRYDSRLGGDPPPDHEPSLDQLTALHQTVFVLKLPPYVDFALFAPHHVRTIRKLRLTGLVMNGSGQLIRTELVGPMSYSQWEACWSVFRTACIMLDISSPAALDAYKDHIKRYATRFSEDCWPLIYQADTRARRELAERIRRQLLKATAVPFTSNDGVTFDGKHPWDFVLRKLPLEYGWWKLHVEDSALLIMSRAISSDSSLTGEAPVASKPTEHIAEPVFHEYIKPATSIATPKRLRSRSDRRSVRLPPGLRNYDVDTQGRHSANRQGRKLCAEFQVGNCLGHTCPSDPSQAHQCAVCLDNRHGASRCHQNPSKGKGKGKGKGKSGKSKPDYHG